MAEKKQTYTLILAFGMAVLAALFGHLLLSVPLLIIAGIIFAWGLEPKRTEEFFGRLPYGEYVVKALAKLDALLPRQN
ncbi:MAG TPA: hypothetical protein VME69_03605 [Methylocella sp.]|nr:hypothetical protein [Methylocella sp.]